MVHLFHKKKLTKAEQRRKDIQDYKNGFSQGFDWGKKNSGWLNLFMDDPDKREWYVPETPYERGVMDGGKKGLKIFDDKEKTYQKHLIGIAKIAKRGK